jgi:predicted RNase H-like HicB family nuclease
MSTNKPISASGFTEIDDVEFKEYPGGVFLCEVHLVPGPQNGFVAKAARLAGLTAQGATEKEALIAITAALTAAAKLHRSQSGLVPWTEPTPAPAGALVRWVTVDTN